MTTQLGSLRQALSDKDDDLIDPKMQLSGLRGRLAVNDGKDYREQNTLLSCLSNDKNTGNQELQLTFLF